MGSTVCSVGWTVPTQFSFLSLQVLSETSSCLYISGTNHPSTDNMKIYKDVFSGDELFSDTYPMKLVDDCVYEVYGKHISRTEGDIQLAGSNASAEGADADEGGDSSTVSGVDLVLNHRLTETGFGSKKDYMVYLKDYMKKVVKYLEENDRTSEVDTFKKNINGVMKDLLGKFKDLQFYQGESMNPAAMIALIDYREIDGEERPVIMFFKHGLEEEKV